MASWNSSWRLEVPKLPGTDPGKVYKKLRGKEIRELLDLLDLKFDCSTSLLPVLPVAMSVPLLLSMHDGQRMCARCSGNDRVAAGHK